MGGLVAGSSIDEKGEGGVDGVVVEQDKGADREKRLLSVPQKSP